ncbi:MAG: HTTM domain-containing protein [Chthonomonas sp.]|nr:HTTM domain-containing protein [Chthonomonas sp.]
MIKKIDRWIFGWGSPFTLGVYRAVLGGLAAVCLLLLSLDFNTWYTESGLATARDAEYWAGPIWHLNLLQGVTSAPVTATLFGLTLISAILSTFGLWTRFSTIALAVGMITLHHRNPFILNGGDTLLRISLITLAVSPCGADFSLDRLLRERKGLPVLDSVSLWPQRLIQIQMTLVYGTTVWHKLNGVHWIDGTAAWYPGRLLEFDRFPTPLWVDLPPFLQAATWGTLIVEAALAYLVYWRPARKWVLLSGVALHAVIEYRFNIPLFAFISVAQYLSHYEGTEVKNWLSQRRQRSQTTASQA